ncbi:hypothetical protein L6452_36723 [Arctium lappa]|uniref:Uncharacterized protein n=1 Tax=Arctium lappa TaxID=4217 RepID=A0ACB8YAW5_ARCLA|nr:hypothetical protein L6452_36723 [Arctium lappa]
MDIWCCRESLRVFQDMERNPNGLCVAIKECIKLKIMGATFKGGVAIDHVIKQWGPNNVNHDVGSRYIFDCDLLVIVSWWLSRPLVLWFNLLLLEVLDESMVKMVTLEAVISQWIYEFSCFCL